MQQTAPNTFFFFLKGQQDDCQAIVRIIVIDIHQHHLRSQQIAAQVRAIAFVGKQLRATFDSKTDVEGSDSGFCKDEELKNSHRTSQQAAML